MTIICPEMKLTTGVFAMRMVRTANLLRLFQLNSSRS